MARGLLKILAIAASIGAGAGLAIPLGIFVGYDLVVFQPALAQAERILATAPPDDRSPPLRIAAMICAFHHGQPDVAAARSILFLKPRHERAGAWAFHYFLTDELVRIHLSARESISIYTSLKQSGNARGLTALSRQLHGKEPRDLSVDETEDLLLEMFWPGILKNPESLGSRRQYLGWTAQRIPALMNDCTN